MKTTSTPHPKSDFLKFAGSLFGPFILPIIPVGAKLSEESSVKGDDLGKIPGKFAHGPKVWFGFKGWTGHRTKKADLERWQSWQDPDQANTPIAIGLRCGTAFIVIDIDINNMPLADKAEQHCRRSLGDPICVRRREGSARRVLIYLHRPGTPPVTKMRITFKHPLTGDEINAIEVLGYGQQVVIEGPHAKGAMHYWGDEKGEAGKGLIDVTEKEVSLNKGLIGADLSAYTTSWTDLVKEEGGENVVASGGRSMRERGDVQEIASPDNKFYVEPKKRGLLTRAMQAISLDDPPD